MQLDNPELPPELRGENGFLNFLWVTWRAINLPDPTPVQYDIGDYIQNGGDNIVIMAFRGIGKSYIAAAFCIFCWLHNPQLIILVVSGNKQRADDFTTFCLEVMEALGPLTAPLMPRDGQRMSKINFDVGLKDVAGSPSMTSRGITSSMTGGRGDLIIGDDVVTLQNSQTQVQREKISLFVKEFAAILKPGGRIVYLCTPQSEADLSHELPALGFDTRIWPVEIPPQRVIDFQGDKLAPMVRKMIANGAQEMDPTDPLRFDREDIEGRRQKYGRAGFAQQFWLDQSLSDLERYPLKLNELILDAIDTEKCYEKYVWTSDPEFRHQQLQAVGGFKGDFYHKPLDRLGSMQSYTGTIMAVDPSGKGADETSYCVASCYAGQVFIHECCGIKGGFEDAVLQRLANIAERYKVQKILIEENFGLGMFEKIIQPYLRKLKHQVGTELVRHSIQKEKRICDTLEPIISQHKMIIDPRVIKMDFESVRERPEEHRHQYMLMNQFARITREKGCLKHDDRIDAMAMACAYWIKTMAQDTDKEMNRIEHESYLEELEEFFETAVGVGFPKKSKRGILNRGWS